MKVAINSYNRASVGSAAEIVTSLMTTILVVRFVLWSMVLIGGIVMFVRFSRSG